MIIAKCSCYIDVFLSEDSKKRDDLNRAEILSCSETAGRFSGQLTMHRRLKNTVHVCLQAVSSCTGF